MKKEQQDRINKLAGAQTGVGLCFDMEITAALVKTAEFRGAEKVEVRLHCKAESPVDDMISRLTTAAFRRNEVTTDIGMVRDFEYLAKEMAAKIAERFVRDLKNLLIRYKDDVPAPQDNPLAKTQIGEQFQ